MTNSSKSVWTAYQLAAIVVVIASGFVAVRAWHVSSDPPAVRVSRQVDPVTTSSLLKLREAR